MYKRKVWDKLKKELENDLVVVITGPRRVGKTTTLHWLLDQLPTENKYYFDLENVINRDIFNIRNYDEILGQLERLGLDLNQRMYIAIDEIQYLENLPSVIKYLHDNFKIKFILSGSSSYYLKNRFSESMSGRKVIYEMYPLTFQEFLWFKDVDYALSDISNLKNFDQITYNKLRIYYDEYLEFGGLPGVVLAKSSEEKRKSLEEIYSAYINLDVQSLSDFKSLNEFRNLVKLLASRVGSKINTSELASILGISRALVESYIEFMEQTYLLRIVPVYSNSVDVIVRKQEKIYFVDNGILGINADISSGSKFENSIAHQLSQYGELKYYEFKNKEVDFILSDKIAFESKETPTADDLKSIKSRTESLKLSQSYLVGRLPNASFSGYIWGGEIG